MAWAHRTPSIYLTSAYPCRKPTTRQARAAAAPAAAGTVGGHLRRTTDPSAGATTRAETTSHDHDDRHNPPRADATIPSRRTRRRPHRRAIDLACRALQLPTMRQRYDEFAAAALREQVSYKRFLADLLEAEAAERAGRRKLRLVHEAGFARPKRLEDFDYTANPAISAEVIGTLADPSWVRQGHPLCLLGDSGNVASNIRLSRHECGSSCAWVGYYHLDRPFAQVKAIGGP